MSSAMPVKGLRELDAYLNAFPRNMQRQAYRSALTAAAKPIRDEARIRAPKQTGKMAKAIRTGSPKQNADGTFSIFISVDGNDHGFLGLFHEYGVAPHYINPGDATTTGGKSMSARLLTRAARRGEVMGDAETQTLRINNNVITGGVFHPGHIARPFMRPALDAKAGEAVQAFAQRIRTFLENKTGFVAPMPEAA